MTNFFIYYYTKKKIILFLLSLFHYMINKILTNIFYDKIEDLVIFKNVLIGLNNNIYDIKTLFIFIYYQVFIL